MFPGELTFLCPAINLLSTNSCDSAGKHHTLLKYMLKGGESCWHCRASRKAVWQPLSLWAAAMALLSQNNTPTFPKNSKCFILLAKQESWIFLMLMTYNSSCDRPWWWRHLLCSLGSNWISSAVLQSAVQQGSWCQSCCPSHFPGGWSTA